MSVVHVVGRVKKVGATAMVRWYIARRFSRKKDKDN